MGSKHPSPGLQPHASALKTSCADIALMLRLGLEVSLASVPQGRASKFQPELQWLEAHQHKSVEQHWEAHSQVQCRHTPELLSLPIHR